MTDLANNRAVTFGQTDLSKLSFAENAWYLEDELIPGFKTLRRSSALSMWCHAGLFYLIEVMLAELNLLGHW
jgi:hypothetical protein